MADFIAGAIKQRNAQPPKGKGAPVAPRYKKGKGPVTAKQASLAIDLMKAKKSKASAPPTGV